VATICSIQASEVSNSRTTTGTPGPPLIRLNYGMQRAHGGGNAVRAIAVCRRWPGTGATRRRPSAVVQGAFEVDEPALVRPDLLAVALPARSYE